MSCSKGGGSSVPSRYNYIMLYISLVHIILFYLLLFLSSFWCSMMDIIRCAYLGDFEFFLFFFIFMYFMSDFISLAVVWFPFEMPSHAFILVKNAFGFTHLFKLIVYSMKQGFIRWSVISFTFLYPCSVFGCSPPFSDASIPLEQQALNNFLNHSLASLHSHGRFCSATHGFFHSIFVFIIYNAPNLQESPFSLYNFNIYSSFFSHPLCFSINLPPMPLFGRSPMGTY